MRKEQHVIEEAGDEDIEENEMEDDMENDINYESDEIEGADENEVEGLIRKRKRGKTLCKNIHARDFKNRQEITLNEEGQPIGPDEKRVAELSSFLGTVARSADLCPLTFNNWKALVKTWNDEEIDPVWEYVNEKYIIPEKGKKDVFAIVSDAWRRYKYLIKKNHFTKYKTMRERLKNRPEEVPEEDFKKLLVYWRDKNSQEVSLQNAQNIAQLKWRHRTGNKAFAVIREKMRVSNEDKEPPSQAEMFIATRQSKKGKELDQETNTAIVNKASRLN
ncbi:putative transposase, Ptta/En/Spm, plant [Medicago truncatula]|uniref:Putative transposase, Ptta/En/Spm, plant n=1 Tax=Medicago truncatula TaxID=3880 RepID=A0A396IQX9_MEDTR|nr:putative transposase, Ptta/En/Spm, plant [Medicago truncatula]